MTKLNTFLSAAAALLISTGCTAPAKVEAPPETAPKQKQNVLAVNSPNAIFKIGDTIKLTVGLEPDASDDRSGKTIVCDLFSEGKKLQSLTIPADKTHTFTLKAEKPGWVHATAAYRKDAKSKLIKRGIGALIEPEKILPAAPEPADFRSFWQQQLAGLKKVPVKLLECKEADSIKGFKTFDIKVACAGNAPVSGYLTIPENAQKGSCNARVIYNGAGVATSFKFYYRDTITLHINAHGIPNARPRKYYSDLYKTVFKNYFHKGCDKRENSYFLNMYLRAVRAVDYIKTRPEWNGKVLLVSGGSQGGGQAIAAAALAEGVTHCVAYVPALGDHSGWKIGRQSGWPRFERTAKDEKTLKAVTEASHYYDNNNFARMIKCPVWMSVGLIDMTCSPTSVLSAYNSLQKPAGIDINPTEGHTTYSPKSARFLDNLLYPSGPKPFVELNRKNAIYQRDEDITFSFGVMNSNAESNGLAGQELVCELFSNAKLVKRETFDAGKISTMTIKPERSRWVYMRVSFVPADSKNGKAITAAVGAVIDPEMIRPAAPEPDDFREFWKEQRKKLDKIPIREIERKKVATPAALEKNFCTFDVKVACTGTAPVSGYLTMPINAKPKTLNAVVFFHGAGVYSSTKRYLYNAICLDVNAHGIENGKTRDFYRDLRTRDLKNYQHRGSNDREKFYFLGMYHRVMRALDYIQSLPEWNGKVLIVNGSSQGGAQAIAAAALDPDVTHCFAFVPALGDHAGCRIGRKSGWPGLYTFKDGEISDPDVGKTAHYFDGNNFARMIKCPVWMSTGFCDSTCPPTSVYSVYNTLDVPEKFIETTPHGTHNTAQRLICNKKFAEIASTLPIMTVKPVLSVNRRNAIFECGEEIKLSLALEAKNPKYIKNHMMLCEFFTDGVKVKSEYVPANKTYTFTTKLIKPGWVYGKVTLQFSPDDRKLVAGIGAMAEPEKILPAIRPPADFKEFWNEKLALLKKSPLKVISKKEVTTPEPYAGKFKTFDVKISAHDSTPVSGYLTIPLNAAEKSLAAVVNYHGAGVRNAVKRYTPGAIRLDINAHGIENGKNADYYRNLYQTTLKRYYLRGLEDRDKYYFVGIYLRAVRALEYVKTLPEWDGKKLIVYGSSQGGAQAIAAAALDPDVTHCFARVPAMGDHSGWQAGRVSGWPKIYRTLRNNSKVLETANYFDGNNFAQLIKCPVWLSAGFFDTVCSPSSVYSVYNSLNTVDKHIESSPDGTHSMPFPNGNAALEQLLKSN